MTWGEIAGMPGITPAVGAAAMALVTAAVEPDHHILGFSHDLVPINISPRQRLDDVIRTIYSIPMGGTDCALPMLWASRMQVRAEVDLFSVYTDSETWAGTIHPAQALTEYRQRSGINAKLAVVGMVSNEFSIADPADPGMLDVVGFDTATPQVLSEFAAAE
jgi:60 kDa SS-A/Ro ribonucleoprotein